MKYISNFISGVVSKSPCLVLASFITILAFLFHFTGFVTPYWNDFLEDNLSSGRFYFLANIGLWKSCFYNAGIVDCGSNVGLYVNTSQFYVVLNICKVKLI